MTRKYNDVKIFMNKNCLKGFSEFFNHTRTNILFRLCKNFETENLRLFMK